MCDQENLYADQCDDLHEHNLPVLIEHNPNTDDLDYDYYNVRELKFTEL